MSWSKTEARKRTEEYKTKSREAWADALELYEKKAHTALEYESWGAYWEAEMEENSSNGYRIVEAARVIKVLTVRKFANGELPANVAQARELVTLKDRPEDMVTAWTNALKKATEANRRVTAQFVRNAVEALDEKWKGTELAVELALRALRLRNWYIEAIGSEAEFEPGQVQLEQFDTALAAVSKLVQDMQLVREGEMSNLNKEVASLLGGLDLDDELAKLLEGEFDDVRDT